MINQADQAYKVSEITAIISGLLEQNLGDIIVEGEISNFRPASSGHWYFSLKDSDAVISVAMFRGRNSRVAFVPKDGMLVRVWGNISVYAKRGSYQIICSRLQQAGTGNILAMLEERKRRLASEGLFDPENKKTIPKLPKSVAVISSPTGAAVRDILHVLERRNAGLHVRVIPCAVQGEHAARQICAGIALANRHSLADVIILGRGGGSLEDLLPFSEESVVRAIANSQIPIISSVGHEIDWALSDFAADLRAPTPSAAAELVTENRADIYRHCINLGQSIAASYMQRLQTVKNLAARFEPETLMERYIIFQHPFLQRLDDAKELLLIETQEIHRDFRKRLELTTSSLEAMSPYTVLQRGYAMIHREDGSILNSAYPEPAENSLLRIHMHDGDIYTRSIQAKQENTHG